MELYLQLGHGMQTLAQEFIKQCGKGTAIISPVNMPQDKISSYANSIRKIGGDVLFDPQMFYPKEGHLKLQAYDYWPQEGCSISDQNSLLNVNRELFRINQNIESKGIILPGIEISEDKFQYQIDMIKKSSDYFRGKTSKELLATLCLYPETIRNSSAIEELIERLRSLDVDGYYIIPHPSNNEYLVSDHSWAIGIMKLLSCLKLMQKKVIVGYSNHQGLIYSLAHVDAIASGTYMNTRSFVPGKFRSPKDDDIKHKSTWFYLPTALTEYKAALLDVAMQRGYLSLFELDGEYKNPYSSMLFSGAMPSSTNYNERNSFLHYLHCLKTQCDLLTQESYDNTYAAYEFLLVDAENQIREIKRRGIAGQNRDFSYAMEANRVAMCANNEDYGFRLEMEWNNL